MKIKNVKIYGLDESIIRSGYPMQTGEPEDLNNSFYNPTMDLTLEDINGKRANKLANTPIGSGHNNFLKGIIVQFDLQYPEYFSPQLQRYHWIDIISSQSKMHRITSRELTKEDFTEHTWTGAIEHCNFLVKFYNSSISKEQKELTFRELISVLPSGYLKWMGISTNYLQLKTIYNQRKSHKLEEWRFFCNWIESLSLSKELITGKHE
jgi:hypothetical protein